MIRGLRSLEMAPRESFARLRNELDTTLRAPLPRRTKAAIAAAQLWRPWSKRPYFRVGYGTSTLLLGRQGLDIDVLTILGVLTGQYFDSDHRGRVIIDGGAHKGYYAVRALERSADAVYSFEPEAANYDAMRLTRELCPLKDRWHIERVALTAAGQDATLNVSAESWAHSLLEPASGGVVGNQTVPARQLPSVLASVRRAHPTSDVIVKLNIEGSAGTVVLSTSPGDWAQVIELWCEFETNEPCPREQIEGHLTAAGFTLAQTIPPTVVQYLRT